jgi:hypothetical protein
MDLANVIARVDVINLFIMGLVIYASLGKIIALCYVSLKVSKIKTGLLLRITAVLFRAI